MKPTVVDEPCVIVPARPLAWIGPRLIAKVRSEAATDRIELPIDVSEMLDKMELVADAARQRAANVPKAVPRAAPPRADVGTSISVKDATSILRIKERGVRALCLRGTLHADKQDDGSWSICVESVTARLENAKCQH